MRADKLGNSSARFGSNGPMMPAGVRNHAGPGAVEITLVALILLGFCCLQLKLAFMLDGWGVFGQYNILFDSDPNRYKGTISSGWAAGGFIHPMFGLAINPPVRIIDACLAFAGITAPGVIRNAAPLLLSPIMATVAALFWWRSAVVMALPSSVRILGLVFSQLVFSQTVFSSIPESFAVSGMLLSVLLYMSVLAVRRPAEMHARSTQLRWLILGCLMSGITVTNGLICMIVWLTLRLKTIPLRQLVWEGIAGLGVVGIFVVCTMFLSGLVYRPGPPRAAPSAQPAQSAPGWLAYFDGSIAARAAHYPVAVLTSVIAPPVEVMVNRLAKPSNRHQVQFSVQDSYNPPAKVLTWAVMLGAAAYILARGSSLAKATLAIVCYNGILHSSFGSETFLYSQHWMAFVTFLIVLTVQRLANGNFSGSILVVLVSVSAIASGLAWSTMIENLT